MGKIQSDTISVGYPVYGAKFQDDNTLIVAGGGGEGNNGIPNKISALSINLDGEKKISVVDEFIIEGKNDSPTSLDLSNETLLIGCSENSENIKEGKNKHLRKFNFSSEKKKISFESSADIAKSTDPIEYQKLVSISKDGSIAAVVSSKVPSSIVVIDPKTLEETDVIEEENEINDIHISPDSKKIVYITDRKVVVVENSAKPILTYERFAPTYTLSKVKFVDNENIIIGVNLKQNLGVLLSHVAIEGDELKFKKSKVINEKTRKITAFDASSTLAAIAGNDGSIYIVGLEHFDVYKRLQKIHTFAITKLAFTPNGEYLASTSAANTVNVIKIPEDIAKSFFWLKFHLVVIFIAFLAYYIHSSITDQHMEDFYNWVDYIFGEDFFKYEIEPSKAPTEATTETFTETKYVEEVVTKIKEGDIVEISTVTSVNTEEDVYQDASSLI